MLTARIKNAFKIIFSIILILVLSIKVEWRSVFSRASQMSPLAYLAIQLLGILAVVVSGFRWKFILKDLPVWNLVKVSFKGQFFSTVLVGQASGDVAKIFSGELNSIARSHLAASIILDKAAGFLALMLLGFLGCLFDERSILTNTLLFFYFLFFLVFLDICRLKKSYLFRLGNFILAKMVSSWSDSTQKGLDFFELKADMKKSVFAGFVYQILNVFTMWVIAHELGVHVSLVQIAWIFSLLSIGLFLPISIAGLGVREWTLVGLLAPYGANADQGTAVSILFFSLTLVQALIGFLIYFYQKAYQPERIT
jgi:glycosyltransferase 2 family protein